MSQPAPAITAAPTTTPLDPEALRRDFPILARSVHGQPLAYLDNAATMQKPQAVIETVDRYYRQTNAKDRKSVV